VIATEDEEWRPAVIIDGARPAVAIAMIPAVPNVWRVWGAAPEDEWRAARLVDLPPPPIGPLQ
jgi:hypothetical protein